MWAALRSDLKEFVSTVSSEGTHALSALDEKLQSLDNDDNDNDNENEDEEFDQYKNRDIPSATVLDGEVFGDGYETTGIIATAADEVARLRSREETYTEELPDTVRLADGS